MSAVTVAKMHVRKSDTTADKRADFRGGKAELEKHFDEIYPDDEAKARTFVEYLRKRFVDRVKVLYGKNEWS